MRLESNIVILRTPEEVWAFGGDLSNVPKWDRGVSGVRQTSQGSSGTGLEFDTLGYSKPRADELKSGRMSYRITTANPVDGCTIELTSTGGNARFFKSASWNFRVEPILGGARLFCSAIFTLHLRYLFLAPILYLKRSAIQFDIEQLKRALEIEGEQRDHISAQIRSEES